MRRQRFGGRHGRQPMTAALWNRICARCSRTAGCINSRSLSSMLHRPMGSSAATLLSAILNYLQMTCEASEAAVASVSAKDVRGVVEVAARVPAHHSAPRPHSGSSCPFGPDCRRRGSLHCRRLPRPELVSVGEGLAALASWHALMENALEPAAGDVTSASSAAPASGVLADDHTSIGSRSRSALAAALVLNVTASLAAAAASPCHGGGCSSADTMPAKPADLATELVELRSKSLRALRASVAEAAAAAAPLRARRGRVYRRRQGSAAAPSRSSRHSATSWLPMAAPRTLTGIIAALSRHTANRSPLRP